MLVPKGREFPRVEAYGMLGALCGYLTKIQEEMAEMAVDALTTRLVKRRLSQKWDLYNNIYDKLGRPNHYRINKEIGIIVNTPDMHRSKVWNETCVSSAHPRTPPHCPLRLVLLIRGHRWRP